MKFRFPSCAFHLPGFCFRSTSCKINSSDFFETPGKRVFEEFEQNKERALSECFTSFTWAKKDNSSRVNCFLCVQLVLGASRGPLLPDDPPMQALKGQARTPVDVQVHVLQSLWTVVPGWQSPPPTAVQTGEASQLWTMPILNSAVGIGTVIVWNVQWFLNVKPNACEKKMRMERKHEYKT